MEFKTCEQYVLAQLAEAQEELERLKEENKLLKGQFENRLHTICDMNELHSILGLRLRPASYDNSKIVIDTDKMTIYPTDSDYERALNLMHRLGYEDPKPESEVIEPEVVTEETLGND